MTPIRTDHDIETALRALRATPTRAWQKKTISALRKAAEEDYVTQVQEDRIHLRRPVASFLSSFPLFIMRKALVPSLVTAAVLIGLVGIHSVADRATPQSPLLYSLDRAFERVELQFARLGGRASLASMHLAFAEERMEEIRVLLLSRGNESPLTKLFFIPKASAQEIDVDPMDALIAELLKEYKASVQAATDILVNEEDGDTAKAIAEDILEKSVEFLAGLDELSGQTDDAVIDSLVDDASKVTVAAAVESVVVIDEQAVCGDGILEGDEQCDDGNSNNNDDCLNSCQNPVCGDGIIWDTGTGTEQCDDGNTNNNDGCSSICEVENGWLCLGEPSECIGGSFNSCGDYCQLNFEYINGACRQNQAQCSNNGETYVGDVPGLNETIGNDFCVAGSTGDTCCCIPRP